MCEVSKKPRWAIVSTGRISQDFCKTLQLSGAMVTCVSSRSLESAQKFAREHGEIGNAFGSLDEMLAHAGELFDVCYVGTPHASHAVDAVKCLRAGAHVLVEKPMAVNAAQVDHMMRVAREEKRFLIEGMWTRFFPLTRELQRLLHDERAIGDVRAVHATFGFYPPPEASGSDSRLFALDDAGGALLDIGVYLLSAASLGFGGFGERHAFERRVQAMAQFDADTGCDTLTTMTLADEGGRTAHLTCSILAELPNEVLYVGTEGYIVVRGPLNSPTKMLVCRNDAERVGKSHERTVEMPIDGADPEQDKQRFNWSESRGFQYEIRAVERAIESGELECAETPLQETLALARIMDKVRDVIGLKYPQEVEQVRA